jgi:chromosome segregation ATPase
MSQRAANRPIQLRPRSPTTTTHAEITRRPAAVRERPQGQSPLTVEDVASSVESLRQQRDADRKAIEDLSKKLHRLEEFSYRTQSEVDDLRRDNERLHKQNAAYEERFKAMARTSDWHGSKLNKLWIRVDELEMQRRSRPKGGW